MTFWVSTLIAIVVYVVGIVIMEAVKWRFLG